MPVIIKAPIVVNDLEEIWYYIALDNPRRADKFLLQLEQKCSMLAETPLIGRLRTELAPDLRSFPVSNYVIFYRPIQNGIELIRILHGARDIFDLGI